MPTPTVTAVVSGKDGGGPFVLSATSLPAGLYAVYVGPNGNATDTPIFNGVPGSGSNHCEFLDMGGGVSAFVMAYLPPLAVGVYRFTFISIPGATQYTSTTICTYIAASFRNRTLALRRVLPPWYRTGIRDMANQKYPQ